MLAKFSDEDADEVMNEVQEMCRVDSYWLDGPEVDSSDNQGGAKEGWEVMYVRLRGLAVLRE